MLEFFGTNPFLQNLFVPDIENSDLFMKRKKERNEDPFLENLIESYNTAPLDKIDKKEKKTLKTIFSEGDSSIFSINEEDNVLELPKSSLISIKLNGDKKKAFLNVESYDKNNNNNNNKDMNNFIIHKIPNENEEIKNESFFKIKSEGSFKNVDNQSFAMNRRGDEFLKMPSLTILPKQSKECNLALENKQQMPIFSKFDTVEAKEKNEEIDYVLRNSVNKKSKIVFDSGVEKNFSMLIDYIYEDVSTWDKVTKNKFLAVYRRKVYFLIYF